MTTKKRGRPPSATWLTSATVNYQALAWEAKQLIDAAKAEGEKLKISDAMRKVMYGSVRRNNDKGVETRSNLVNIKFPTAYDAVRKILKASEKKSKEV